LKKEKDIEIIFISEDIPGEISIEELINEIKLINKNEADLTEKPNISILEITEKRSRSAENNRPRNLTKV